MQFKKKPAQNKPEKQKLRVPPSDEIKRNRKGEPDLEVKVQRKARALGTELALIDTKANTSVALEVLNTRFGKQSQTIVDLIDMGNSDGASSLIVKALLQSLVEVLPMAEHNIRETRATKGIYGFNTLVTSMRELLGDLQSLKDRANLGQSIVDKTVRPSYMDIAVQVVSGFTLLQDSAKARMDASDFKEFRRDLESTKKGLSDYLMAQYRDVSEQVVKSLG